MLINLFLKVAGLKYKKDEWIVLWPEYRHKSIKQFGNNIQVGASLTFTNIKDSFKWEPKAAIQEERFEALQILHDSGVRTWASMEPVIYPEQSLGIIEITHPYIDAYKIGKLNHFPNHEPKFDWPKFLTDAVSIMHKHDKQFYIKKGLRRHKPASLILNPNEIDKVIPLSSNPE